MPLVTLFIAPVIPPKIPLITLCAALKGAVNIFSIVENTLDIVDFTALAPVDTTFLIAFHAVCITFFHPFTTVCINDFIALNTVDITDFIELTADAIKEFILFHTD